MDTIHESIEGMGNTQGVEREGHTLTSLQVIDSWITIKIEWGKGGKGKEHSKKKRRDEQELYLVNNYQSTAKKWNRFISESMAESDT